VKGHHSSGLLLGLACAAVAAEPPASPRLAGPPAAAQQPIGGLSLALAEQVAHAAIDTCLTGHQHVSVVILDEHGALRLSISADGALSGTSDVARRKANTVLEFREDGLPLTDRIAGDATLSARIAEDPALWPRPRGARLITGPQGLRGVIGVSGSLGHDPGVVTDDDCAVRALKTISDSR
jgi:uncharacterized protein GlcG (DUF336 family)